MINGAQIRAVIIGGSQSGKTFLASGFARGLWAKKRMRSIVFDPWEGETDWGPGAYVSRNFEQWRHIVTNTKGFCIVWDEATSHGGRTRANVPLFTEIRHRHPVLFCLGHAYSVILPIMRTSLTDLFLANADGDDAKKWAGIMKDAEVRQAVDLPQYAFLHKRNFRPIAIRRETAAAIKMGVLP